MEYRVEFRRAQLSDVEQIAPRLRAKDQFDIKAMTTLDPLTVVKYGFDMSDKCWVGYIKDKVIGIFGVCPSEHNPKIGIPFLLTSHEINDLKYLFKRQSKLWLEEMIRDYDMLVNFTPANNEQVVRWLKWLGFELPEFYKDAGINGEDIWKFRIYNEKMKAK